MNRSASEPPLITFTGVGLTYAGPPRVTALRHANVRINRGEYVTVVGPSGSGKSTFLNVLGLLDRPTDGVFEIDGIDVSKLNEPKRTMLRGRRIGFVFQSYHLLPYRTAIENVALAQLYSAVPRRQRLDAARQALDQVGLAHRAHAMPSTMSGGEQQRVAIARAVTHRPSLLLCDEPTGNLDSGSAASILALLDQLNRDGITLVVITHDLAVADRGHRTLAICDGVVT
jgi:putative ABC transport system ATP-binding protein